MNKKSTTKHKPKECCKSNSDEGNGIPKQDRMEQYKIVIQGWQDDVTSLSKIMFTLSSASLLASLAFAGTGEQSAYIFWSCAAWGATILLDLLSLAFSIRAQWLFAKDIANFTIHWNNVKTPSNKPQTILLIFAGISFITGYIFLICKLYLTVLP